MKTKKKLYEKLNGDNEFYGCSVNNKKVEWSQEIKRSK